MSKKQAGRVLMPRKDTYSMNNTARDLDRKPAVHFKWILEINPVKRQEVARLQLKHFREQLARSLWS